MLPSFSDLHRQADANAARVPIAVAGGAEGTVLAALRQAADHGWVEPLLFGGQSDMRQAADEHQVPLDGFHLFDADKPAQAAVAAVRRGRARLLLKGQISTPELMAAVLATDTGLRTGRVVCQVPLMEIVPTGRRFLLADTGVTIQPTLEQKIDILRGSVELAHALGAAEPRVALMAATKRAAKAAAVDTSPRRFFR